MGWYGFAAVGVGAALGAWLRWLLGAALDSLFPTLPPGTLAANLIGALLMGCAMGAFAHFQALPAEVRLFVITGFLGGLTTFSTFSGEATLLLQRQQYLWFGGHIAAHVVGSLAMTLAGMALIRALLRA